MAIVVGDIHGNVEKVKAWLAYKPEVEHVALGDYLDSFYEPQERQIETLELLLKSDAVLLWGNHELNYVDHAPWLSAGYQYGLEKPYIDRLEANINRFKAAYAVDGWLCTHAGVSEKIVKLVGDNPDPAAVADWLNVKMVKWLHDRANKNVLFDIGKGRGGSEAVGGIFWYDHLREIGLADIKQLFGHTAGKEVIQKDSYVCLDTTNVPGVAWVWDTAENELVGLETDSFKPLINDLPVEFRVWLDDREIAHNRFTLDQYRAFLKEDQQEKFQAALKERLMRKGYVTPQEIVNAENS